MTDTKSSKKFQLFQCIECDYNTYRKSQWQRHIATNKHQRLTNTYIESTHKYKCRCGKEYKQRQSLYNHKKRCKNLKTPNHFLDGKQMANFGKQMANSGKMSKNEKLFKCECGKTYKHACSLSKHKTKCIFQDSPLMLVTKSTDIDDMKTIIMNLIEQNKEIIEQNTELARKPTNITNNNTQFNVMNYLNTECADAMNISDFINDFQFSLKDLETLGTKGYQEAMEQTFIKQLFDMDKTKRPIHCSDKKRKSFYIKDNDVWEKDNNNEKLILSMKNLSNVHNKAISNWQRSNNDWLDNDRKHDFYLKYVFEFTKCGHEKERNKIINKLVSLTIK